MASDSSVRYPRSRIEKLGVKEGDRVGMVAFQDAAFERELAGRGATLVKGGLGANLPMIVCAFRETDELDRLEQLKTAIAPNGCVWALWPKGRKELREDHVRAAALAAGLVDVKVMAFSDVLSGLKLVIPKAARASVAGSRGKTPPKASAAAAGGTTTEVTAVVRLRVPARKPANRAKRARRKPRK